MFDGVCVAFCCLVVLFWLIVLDVSCQFDCFVCCCMIGWLVVGVFGCWCAWLRLFVDALLGDLFFVL